MKRVAPFALAGAVLTGCGGEQHDPPAPSAPRLRVEQRPALPGRPTTLVVDVTQRRGGAPLGTADIVVPAGVRIVPPAGGMAGEVEAALGDEIVSGPLGPAPQTRCADSKALVAATFHTGMHLAVGIRRDGGETRLSICPPKHADLRRVTLRFRSGVTSPAAGDTVWRGLFAAPESRASTESRAVVQTPSFLTIEAADGVRAGGVVRLHGYLYQHRAQPNRKVRILAGPSADKLEPVGRVRTGANGSWSFPLRLPDGVASIVVAARVASVERACDAPCSVETVGGTSSRPLRLSTAAR